MKQIIGTKSTRALGLFERAAIDESARTVSLAFASEAEVDRGTYIEILSLAPGAMRTERLANACPLLLDHESDDLVGVVESASVGVDRIARAVCKVSRSPDGEAAWMDLTDGIRRSVSVGYIVHAAEMSEMRDGREVWRVTDWEPIEISLVSIPADITVGVGRSLDAQGCAEPAKTQPDVVATTKQQDPIMTTEVIERNHAAEISKIAATIPGGAELAMSAIQRGLTVEAFQAEALARMASKPVPTADIGLSKAETRRYSMMRAINALANPQDRNAQDAAAFERECSDAAAAKVGKTSRGLYVPTEIQRRDLTAGTNNAGGYTVATDLLAGDFISLLRNAMVLDSLGARMLTGLTGNVAIPKLSGAATAYWVAENNAPTESQQTIAQVTLSPKTVGAYTDFSRRLMLQSSIDVEQMVMSDLAMVLGLAIQQAAISGSGSSNQPSGILTQVTASVVGGTNGAAPTWANIVALETDVSVSNADVGNLAYLTNAKVRGKLKTTIKEASVPGYVWADGATPLNGYRAAVTNAVPSNLTKGSASTCSAIIFGNFADLVVGMWGGLDLMVDPYTGSNAGTVRVVALQDVDIALRNVVSFATMVDALTA